MAQPLPIFEKIMELEGGGVLHRVEGDPGGTTKWGFSQRAHPDVDIENLDHDDAFGLFVVHYWNPLKLWDVLSDKMAFEIAEFAFHAGFSAAVRAAQHATNALVAAAPGMACDEVTEDGRIGPNTLRALNQIGAHGPIHVLAWVGQFNRAQLQHYRRLRPELVRRFLAGWTRRLL